MTLASPFMAFLLHVRHRRLYKSAHQPTGQGWHRPAFATHQTSAVAAGLIAAKGCLLPTPLPSGERVRSKRTASARTMAAPRVDRTLIGRCARYVTHPREDYRGRRGKPGKSQPSFDADQVCGNDGSDGGAWCPLVAWRHHARLKRRGSSGGGERQLTEHLLSGLVERGEGLLLTAAAAIATAGTRLQLGKIRHAIGRFAADIVIGDAMAHADVHARMETRMRTIVNNKIAAGCCPFRQRRARRPARSAAGRTRRVAAWCQSPR